MRSNESDYLIFRVKEIEMCKTGTSREIPCTVITIIIINNNIAINLILIGIVSNVISIR